MPAHFWFCFGLSVFAMGFGVFMGWCANNSFREKDKDI